MSKQTHKTEGENRTQNVWFHPFVFTSNAPRKGTCGVPADLDEAIPLKTIKYNEQRDEETIGPLGGRYENYYKYDPLHRLTRAGGSNQYRFEQAFELSRAGRPLSMSTNGMVKHYAYGEHTPPHAPQRIMVEDGYRRTLHDLRWDLAGNLGQVSTLAHDMGDIQSRFLFWTEDNRLHTVVDDRHHSYYAYDHAGERTLKVTGHSHQLDVNADLMHTAAGLDEFTLYPSPYLVFTNRGYTKHYYAGTERLAARLGGGFDRAILREQTDLAMTATHLFKQSQHHTNDRHLNAPPAHTIRREGHLERVFRGMEIEFAIPEAVRAEVHLEPEGLIQAAQNIVSDNTEPDVYFYHSDHLGSASWITDGDGIPVQHLQYLPYGEPFVNQRAAGSTYRERFTFTGKERDEETGYSYFGARYMDHELMTMWLSVDPLADKYPSISPYAYCAWNPVKLVDPDGRDIDPSCIKDWKEQRVSILDKRNKLATVREVVGGNISWGQQIRGFSGCSSLPWMSKMSELNERIESLDETLSMMGKLENDHSTTYTLSRTTGNGSVYLVTEGEKKGMVSIIFSNTSSFVHEVTHAGQYYNNDIGFFLNTGAIAAYDIYDEVNAYKAALAYSPYSYDNKRMFMHQVTPEWVRPRSDTYSGCGTISVNIFSPATQINSSGINNLGQYHDYLEIPSNLLMYRH